jgi:hypothetical protein
MDNKERTETAKTFVKAYLEATIYKPDIWELPKFPAYFIDFEHQEKFDEEWMKAADHNEDERDKEEMSKESKNDIINELSKMHTHNVWYKYIINEKTLFLKVESYKNSSPSIAIEDNLSKVSPNFNYRPEPKQED